MNLTTDPWIPIVWRNGQSDLVNLKDAFERGEEIADLAVRPHERIALMRLLICIAQAALDGPEDEEEWKKCKVRMVPSALAYLDKWKAAFELLGDGARFLQVQDGSRADKDIGEDDAEAGDVSKLDLVLAAGSNSTLFDNAGGSNRVFNPSQLALMLLSFQCFSPLFGRGYKGKGPCVEGNMLHSVLKRPTLCATVHVNLIPKQLSQRAYGEGSWGVPYWEKPPTVSGNSEACKNATETYLGRLVPLTRSVRLAKDGRSMTVGNGLEYPAFREPTATVLAVADGTNRKTLACSVGKSTWRELHSLLVKRLDEAQLGGPLGLKNPLTIEGFDLWAGGLVTDGKAKILDAIESNFSIPPGMRDKQAEQSLLRYQDGVLEAEKREQRLLKAVTAYSEEIKESSSGRRENAQKRFWTAIDQQVTILLDTIGLWSESLDRGETPPEDLRWSTLVIRSQVDAYNLSCPHNTCRQMQAYVKGLATLTHSRKQKKRSSQ